MKIKVLGSAAGGGFPQWNCGCSNCDRARRGLSALKPRTQTQVAVSAQPGSWILLNASPDLRQQILADPDFAPAATTRATPVSTIILNSADVDSVMGLFHLREFQPLRIFATPSVIRILTEENSLFRCLERSIPSVQWEPLHLGRKIEIAGVTCTAGPIGGDFPDYVNKPLRQQLAPAEAVICLELVHGGKKFVFAPSISSWSAGLIQLLKDSDLSLLDGTFWTENELIKVRGSGKTAREIGHIPISGAAGLFFHLAHTPRKPDSRRVLIHINNTNPILDESSDPHRAVRDAGLEVAYDGMEFEL
jgi:pyrroloquinoline quinone biosynthesis protein B